LVGRMFPRDQRERLPKEYTSHEVTAANRGAHKQVFVCGVIKRRARL